MIVPYLASTAKITSLIHVLCVSLSRSKCPNCNKKVSADKLYSDWAFDNLIKMVSVEKNKAENNYFVNLIQEAGI